MRAPSGKRQASARAVLGEFAVTLLAGSVVGSAIGGAGTAGKLARMAERTSKPAPSPDLRDSDRNMVTTKCMH